MRMTRLAACTASFCLAIGIAAAGPAANSAASPAMTAGAAATASAPSPADVQFNELAKRWLDGSMRLSPVGATQTGDHRFDSELDDLSAAGRAKSEAFSRQMLDELNKIDRSKLSRENQVDAALLGNQLRYDVFNADKIQAWAWDPTAYTGLEGSALFTLMARDFAPMPERLRSATARIEKLPAIYEQMRANLDPRRVPEIYAQTAAKQSAGALEIIDSMIVPNEKDLPAADRARLDAAIANLRKVIPQQTQWLNKTLVPNAKGNFRIGKELFDEKLHFALDSTLSRQEIRKRAEAEVVNIRQQMYAIARDVLKGKPGAPATPDNPTQAQQQAAIQAALDMAAADRPNRNDVVEVAKAELAKATDFVRAHDLITLPNAPVQVILMPEFARGVAVAYCDSPGPLDKNLATFYAVSPIPDDWTDAQATSFLKEYNTRSIAELGVHEAMPGHYVQIWHSNQFPSTVRAVLGSGSFIEGWAVYAEHMMAEQGFLDRDPLYRLVQLKWYLRATVNAILDQSVHVDGISREDAMKLLTQTAFQEEREAAGKWTRAQLSSTQLSTYFVGAQEHFDLLRQAKAKWGKDFNLKRYHDTVTSFGSPPARYVGELMFDEPIK